MKDQRNRLLDVPILVRVISFNGVLPNMKYRSKPAPLDVLKQQTGDSFATVRLDVLKKIFELVSSRLQKYMRSTGSLLEHQHLVVLCGF